MEYWICLSIFPFFFSSNWVSVYQDNDYNGGAFTIRTRSVNGLLRQSGAIVGTLIIGFLLDWQRFSRRTRAKMGYCIIWVIIMVVWGCTYIFEKDNPRILNKEAPRIDVTNSYGALALYPLFFGISDSIYQTYAYWLMRTLSNSSRHLAYYAGFYKCLQSVGSAIMFRLDAQKTSYSTIFFLSWGSLMIGLLFAFYVVFFLVEESKEGELLQANEGVNVTESEMREKGVIRLSMTGGSTSAGLFSLIMCHSNRSLLRSST